MNAMINLILNCRKLFDQSCTVKYKRIVSSNRIKENIVTFIKNIWPIFKMQEFNMKRLTRFKNEFIIEKLNESVGK